MRNAHCKDERPPTFDTRELGQVIYDNFAGVDMVVNERKSFFRPVSSKNRHTSKAETSWSQNFLGPVGPILCFFL